jgi:16S rRNA (adenine1518-N6/adenine1519-N6)-dimethyltransferase
MKRYGQHFLVNRHAVERIVDSLHLSPTDSVLEIGPGKGVLTSTLIARAGHVTAVEVDDKLIPYLTKKYSSAKNFTLVHQDFMDFDLSQFKPDLKIVGNLPYNLTSPILRKICGSSHWKEALFMVQREVGDRLAAQAGNTDFGALTVGVSLHAEIERVFDLSETSFDPPPRVKSTVVRLKRREVPLTREPEAIQRVVQAAFQQRRKTILNALSHGLTLTKEEVLLILQELHIDPGCRAETIPVEAYVRLGHLIHLKNSL